MLDTLHFSFAPMTVRAVAEDLGWLIPKTRRVLDRLVGDLSADRRGSRSARYEITGRGQSRLFRKVGNDEYPKGRRQNE